MRRNSDRLAAHRNPPSFRATRLAALCALPISALLAACGVTADTGADFDEGGDTGAERLGRGSQEIINV